MQRCPSIVMRETFFFQLSDSVRPTLSYITNHAVCTLLLHSHVCFFFLNQADKSWGIGHNLFAITKSCRISQSACRSLRLMAFQVKQEQGYTHSIHKNSLDKQFYSNKNA